MADKIDRQLKVVHGLQISSRTKNGYLGIIEERERKVDVIAHLKMLWEEEPTD